MNRLFVVFVVSLMLLFLLLKFYMYFLRLKKKLFWVIKDIIDYGMVCFVKNIEDSLE